MRPLSYFSGPHFIAVRWISNLLEHEASVWSVQNWGVRKVCAGRYTHCLLINQNLIMRQNNSPQRTYSTPQTAVNTEHCPVSTLIGRWQLFVPDRDWPLHRCRLPNIVCFSLCWLNWSGFASLPLLWACNLRRSLWLRPHRRQVY